MNEKGLPQNVVTFFDTCLFPAVPAVCAEFAGSKIDRFDHVVETMVMKGCEIQFFPDLFKHRVILIRIGIRILLKYLLREIGCSFEHLNLSSRDQFTLRVGPGEIKILTSEHKGRARGSYMYFTRTAAVQILSGLP